MTRTAAACLALLLPTLSLADGPATSPAPVPVRVRILRGARQAPPAFDPKLADLRSQLSKLSYVRWEQVSEQTVDMSDRKPHTVQLPNGDEVTLVVEAVKPRTITVEVALSRRRTRSRLTIGRGQRIVHQVTAERDGVAYFVTVHGMP